MDRLRRFLAPPLLEGEDRQSTAALLNNVLLIALFLVIIALPILLLIDPGEQPLFLVGLSAVIVAGILLVNYLLAQGYLRLASWLATLGLLSVIGATMIAYGGLHHVNTLSLAVALTVGSLLLRERRAILTVAVLATLTGIAIFLGQALEYFTYPPQMLQLQDLILFVLIVGIISSVLAYAMSNLDAALARSRASERRAQEARENVEALNLVLEARVAARTRALQLSADISRRLSTILDRDALIRAVVEQLQQAFNYYHVHIYLLDEGGHRLHLVGGTGEPARKMLDKGHAIEVGQGLVGRAADTNVPVLAPNVAREPDWLSNPLLPETQAEIAVPIARADEVIGVLDVQHHVRDGLTGEDVQLIQTISNQIAVAMQNADLYRQAQQRAEEQQLLNTIADRIQRSTTVEQALQVAVRELGWALDGQSVRVNLRPGEKMASTASHD